MQILSKISVLRKKTAGVLLVSSKITQYIFILKVPANFFLALDPSCMHGNVFQVKQLQITAFIGKIGKSNTKI